MRHLGSVLTFIFTSFSQAFVHNQARFASVVLGNTIYIDGGEVTTWDGNGPGTLSSGADLATTNITNTISIDLSESWRNSTVPITTIPKTTASFQSGALWIDPSQESFYSYDGGVSLAKGANPNVQPNELLSYSPSTQWTQVSVPGNFTFIVRVQEALYASGNGLGFALGGYQNPGTTNYVKPPVNDTYTKGLIMYNMTSRIWYNFTQGGTYEDKEVHNGVAHFITDFGPAGVYMPLAGETSGGDFIDLATTTLFEPTTQQWRTQRTSGDIPPPVQNPCVVGKSGDNGTYEVFLYGGLQQTQHELGTADGSVYVLTLPAFHWIKVPGTSQGRYRHTCSADQGRHMLSVGGIVINGTANTTKVFGLCDADFGVPDPWPNGLGVFDLTALQWLAEYDAHAGSYRTPDVVKSYLATFGPSPSSYDDEAVKSWFSISRVATNSSIPQTNTIQSSSPESSTTTSTTLSKGGIAGIIVAVVVVAAMISLGCWLVIRNRRRRRGYGYANADDKAGYADLATLEPNKGNPAELHDKPRPHEAGGIQVYELDHQRHELGLGKG